MRNIKSFLLMTLLPFLCLSKVYASCTQEEINNFKKIEDEYKVTYEFDTENKTYTLHLTNPSFEKYGYVLRYNESDTHEIEINLSSNQMQSFIYPKLLPGNYEIQIIGITNNCTDKLKTINLILPKYNVYSEEPLCEGIEEFVLCQTTYDKEISYETFVSRVETYKKNKNDKIVDDEQKNNDENKKFNTILEFIKDNLINIIIIITFMILLIVTIIISIKSLKERRRLE